MAHYASFAAMLHLLHNVTNVQETFLHKSSHYMESAGESQREAITHALL